MAKFIVCALSFFCLFSSGLLNGADRKVPAGYRLMVDPGKATTHPGEEVVIAAVVERQYEPDDFEYKDHQGEYVGLSGQRVEIKKVTGLADGEIKPADKLDTDMMGVAHFTYKAGQHDRQVIVEFEHVFHIRYPRPARVFTGKSVITVTPYKWEGTISKTESMKSGKGESLLAALTPGGKYDLSKNWAIHVAFKPSASYDVNETYAVEKAELLEFEDRLDQTMFEMEREGRRIEGKAKETAETGRRPLSAKECDLLLQVDPEKGTYYLAGTIKVKGISGKGKGEVEVRVKPVDKKVDEDEEVTSEIDEEIDFSGKFKPDAGKFPERLKGSKDLLADAPEGMEEFMESLGGKQTQILDWDLKRK